MRTKVVLFFIFFQELSNKKKIKELRPKMTKIASRGGGSCLNIGKGRSYSGAELQTFVKDRQDRQREERQLDREARREDAEEKPGKGSRTRSQERGSRTKSAGKRKQNEKPGKRKQNENPGKRKLLQKETRRSVSGKQRSKITWDMTRIRSERRERAIGQENDEGEQEGDLEEVEGRRKPPRIPMPKFDHDSS